MVHEIEPQLVLGLEYKQKHSANMSFKSLASDPDAFSCLIAHPQLQIASIILLNIELYDTYNFSAIETLLSQSFNQKHHTQSKMSYLEHKKPVFPASF